MSFNNEVDGGFECSCCGGVFSKMWGTVCNLCRERRRQHQEMLTALAAKPKDTLPMDGGKG